MTRSRTLRLPMTPILRILAKRECSVSVRGAIPGRGAVEGVAGSLLRVGVEDNTKPPSAGRLRSSDGVVLVDTAGGRGSAANAGGMRARDNPRKSHLKRKKT